MNAPDRKTILVVDDEKEICDYFEVVLSKEGFRVIKASNGEDALNYLKKEGSEAVDLVTLDLKMPGRGGYDIIKELQEPGYREVPIFVVTARSLDSVAVDMIRLETNVKEFWGKPVDFREFRKRIHETLGTQPMNSGQALGVGSSS